MPLAVSDSSTLIHLSKLGLLELLRALFDQVVVPEAVWREVVVEAIGRAGAAEVRRAREQGWLSVRAAGREDIVALALRELDPGESEALALAVELEGSVVLLDESEARRIAERLSVSRTGTLGVLLAARRRNLVAELRPILERLRSECGFWISDALLAQALEAVGEGADNLATD